MKPFRVQKAEGKTDVGPVQAKMVTGAMSNLLVGGMCACRFGRIAIGKKLSNENPHIKLTSLENIGHYLQLEAADLVAECMLQA